jgi:hypothetical protein
MKASGIPVLRSGLIDALYDSFGQAVQRAAAEIRGERLIMDGLSRFERSCMLVKASWDVLRADGELIGLPVLSGIASLIVIAAFGAMATVAAAFGHFDHVNKGSDLLLWFYAGLFVFYIVQYFIIIYFNTALVGAAIERLEGGNPSIRSALALADQRFGAIFGYAFISATIGLLLRMIAERLGIIGRFIESGVGLAWTITTFLVVPVLAAEGCGPVQAIERSASLLKKTWGENLIGNAGISLAVSFLVAFIVLIGVVGGFRLQASGSDVLAISVFAITGVLFIIVVVVSTALSGIYAAAVYQYAINGRAPRGFDGGLIEGSFACQSK